MASASRKIVSGRNFEFTKTSLQSFSFFFLFFLAVSLIEFCFHFFALIISFLHVEQQRIETAQSNIVALLERVSAAIARTSGPLPSQTEHEDMQVSECVCVCV